MEFIPSEEGCKWINMFDGHYSDSKIAITKTKKIDFILWQLGAKIKKEKNGKTNP